MAVYFPIRHRTFVSVRRQSRVIIFTVWIFAVGMGLLFNFKCKMTVIISVISTLILSIIIIIIYGLIAPRMMLNRRKMNGPVEPIVHQTGQNLANDTEFLVVPNSVTIIAFIVVCLTPWIVLTMLLMANTLYAGEANYSVAYYIIASNPLWDPLIYFFFACYRRRNSQPDLGSKNILINSI